MADAVTRDFAIGPFLDAATRWLAEPEGSRARRGVAVPVPAATVMLVRGAPLEVYMLERVGPAVTTPPTWVFPGGRARQSTLDAGSPSVRFDDDGLAGWAVSLGVAESVAHAVLVAALRETFVETGVLLASEPSAGLVDVTDPVWGRRREAVRTRQATFEEVTRGLELRGDLVAAVDRWITPEFEARRYDTWFLAAALPEGAEVRARPGRSGAWVTPERMLARVDEGDVALLPPTATALERLSRVPDAEAALRQARDASFRPTRPRLLVGPDGPYLQAEINL